MYKLITLLLTIFLSFSFTTLAQNNSGKKVLISQIVTHPALDKTVKGIKEGLKEEGYFEDKNLNLRVESAQGNASLASQIASKFVNQSPDVVVGVGTVTAQSFIKYARDNKVKMIFSSVTDPVSAGIVENLNQGGGNISGVSNFVDLKPQLELFLKIQPSLKTLGIIYNPSEINSVSIVKKLTKLCNELKINLVKVTASKTSEISQTAIKLASNVDAIFISNDNTALSALSVIINIAKEKKIPVYVSDTDAVKLGAVAALGPNQYEIGLQTGKMIAKILDGENINNFTVKFPIKTKLYLNLSAASAANLEIPDEVISKASKVFK